MRKAVPSLPATLAALLSCFVLICAGCNGSSFNPINPPTVGAFNVPVNCDSSGACSGVYNMPFGYCQWSTYQSPNKTFTVAMEIGMNRNANPGEVEACEIPLAFGGIIKSIDGNTNYTPWTANLSSMFLNIRSCATGPCPYPSDQEHLAAQKFTVKGSPQSLPLHGAYATGITANYINFVWNDDIANAKPTTINIAFSGTFQ